MYFFLYHCKKGGRFSKKIKINKSEDRTVREVQCSKETQIVRK